MQTAPDLAIEYAKVRVQFDRPIATFQATKHKAAEMLQRIELSRVGMHYAAWASDVDEPVRAEAAAMAKAFVPESANEVTGECIQIHGGVGFTWDCDAHLHYRRAKQNDLLLGYHGIHRERVADLVLDPLTILRSRNSDQSGWNVNGSPAAPRTRSTSGATQRLLRPGTRATSVTISSVSRRRT